MTGPRIRPAEAAALLGYSVRTIQDLARRGRVPGAAQLAAGGRWTFDRAKLIAFRDQLEAETWRRAHAEPAISTRGAPSGMADLNLPAANIVALSRLAIGLRPGPRSKPSASR